MLDWFVNRVGQLNGKVLDCGVKRLGQLYVKVLDWEVNSGTPVW